MHTSTTGNSTIPKSSPVLVGNLSAGYLQTGDLFVQVFPRMNPQVPMKVLVLVLSPNATHSYRALEVVHAFNPYDLYSKTDEPVDPVKLRPYYESLIAKFFLSEVDW